MRKRRTPRQTTKCWSQMSLIVSCGKYHQEGQVSNSLELLTLAEMISETECVMDEVEDVYVGLALWEVVVVVLLDDVVVEVVDVIEVVVLVDVPVVVEV